MHSESQESRFIVYRTRPLRVTILAVFVLFIAGSNLLRFYESIRHYGFLEMILPFSPQIILFSGLFWGLIGLAVFIINWLGWRLAPIITIVFAVLFIGYGWIDRLFLSKRSVTNWQFFIGVEIVALILLFWILHNRKAKIFFGVNA